MVAAVVAVVAVIVVRMGVEIECNVFFVVGVVAVVAIDVAFV